MEKMKNVLDFSGSFIYNTQAKVNNEYSLEQTCRSRVVGRARTIGNRVTLIRCSRVRIPPSAPMRNPQIIEILGIFYF